MVTITSTPYLCSIVKKITAIALAVIYLVSTFGISINRFYCCGKLQSQNIGVALFNKVQPKDSDCCKHTQTVIKVKDSHEQVVPSENVLVSAAHAQPNHHNAISYSAPCTGLTATNFYNGPPWRASTTPLYIRFCTYRI